MASSLSFKPFSLLFLYHRDCGPHKACRKAQHCQHCQLARSGLLPTTRPMASSSLSSKPFFLFIASSSIIALYNITTMLVLVIRLCPIASSTIMALHNVSTLLVVVVFFLFSLKR